MDYFYSLAYINDVFFSDNENGVGGGGGVLELWSGIQILHIHLKWIP